MTEDITNYTFITKDVYYKEVEPIYKLFYRYKFNKLYTLVAFDLIAGLNKVIRHSKREVIRNQYKITALLESTLKCDFNDLAAIYAEIDEIKLIILELKQTQEVIRSYIANGLTKNIVCNCCRVELKDISSAIQDRWNVGYICEKCSNDESQIYA